MVDGAFGGSKLSVEYSEFQLVQAHLSQIQTRIRWEVFRTVRIILKSCTFGLNSLKLRPIALRRRDATREHRPQLSNQLKISAW